MGWPRVVQATVILPPAKPVFNKRREFQGDVFLKS